MNQIRDVLNKTKWTDDLSKVEIWYVHRGAPKDTRSVSGSEVQHITSWCIETKQATIPFHRIFRITVNEMELYIRKIGKTE